MVNRMSSADEPPSGSNSGNASSSSWSLYSLLGLDRCLANISPTGVEQARAIAEGRSNSTATSDGSGQDPAKQSGGLMAMAYKTLGILTPEEKREAAWAKHLEMMKEGGLFTLRSNGGKAPAPMWIQLAVEKDECSAKVEWRSPQLVKNLAVGKEGFSLDTISEVRKVSEAEASFFGEDAKGPSPKDTEVCFVIVTAKKKAVFETNTKEDCDTWVAALQEALVLYVKKLDQNLQKKLKDERRQKEIEDRKSSRDQRRAEYAKAGMSNTARIMAQGTRSS